MLHGCCCGQPGRTFLVPTTSAVPGDCALGGSSAMSLEAERRHLDNERLHLSFVRFEQGHLLLVNTSRIHYCHKRLCLILTWALAFMWTLTFMCELWPSHECFPSREWCPLRECCHPTTSTPPPTPPPSRKIKISLYLYLHVLITYRHLTLNA